MRDEGMSSSILIVFNPSSAGGRSLRQKSRVEALLDDRGIVYDLVLTESEAHLKACASDGIGKYEIIIGAGGDTTFNLIANEMVRKPSETALGIVGLGSVNDVARQFGVQTLERAVEAIGAGGRRKTDLGRIRGKGTPPLHFLGTASLGLGPLVTQYVDAWMGRHPVLKRRRAGAQVWAGLQGTYRAFRRGAVPVTFEIATAGRHESIATPFLIFNNTAYAAGGFKVSAAADPHDGMLDCTYVDAACFSALYRAMAELKTRGSSGKVHTAQNERFEVRAAEPFDMQVDGDILTFRDTVTISSVPGVLDVLVHPDHDISHPRP